MNYLIRKTLRPFFFIVTVQLPILAGEVATEKKVQLTSEKKPETTVLVFDLDDTLIGSTGLNKLKRNLSIVWKSLPMNFFNLLSVRNHRQERSCGDKRFCFNNQPAPGGGCMQFAFLGVQGTYSERFQSFIPSLLNTTWKYTDFLPGVFDLLYSLIENKKHRDVTIVFATNKDYVSYVDVAASIDKKSSNAFSNTAAFTLVTQPTQSWLDTYLDISNKKLPKPFADFIHRIKNANETEAQKNRIFFARKENGKSEGYEKPDAEYFTILETLLKTEIEQKRGKKIKKIIFFDDKQANVIAAKKTINNLEGYIVKTTKDIVKGLLEQNVLSKKEDSYVLRNYQL
ncbi:hypothetical protein IPH25_00925 [bacterium]|nr:MAG: hypothetical protein IPG37_03045 [bacterium]QQR61989.1 MAG: hypothetical protein IPH25_00925 [bacterium]QQR62418.1 MAG: hypothetical protein IPH67_03235 [bacterium]